MNDPILIGWRERVDLPDWGLSALRAKADTGARSSAIDVAEIEELADGTVRFVVVTDRKDPAARWTLEAPISRRTRVRSSFGQDHDRLFVTTRIRLAGIEFTTEVGLVSRRSMISRMLLGRRTLANRFAVDSARRYLHRPSKRRQSASAEPAEGDKT